MAKKKAESKSDIVHVKRTDRGDKILPYKRPIADRLVAKGLGVIVTIKVTEEDDAPVKNPDPKGKEIDKGKDKDPEKNPDPKGKSNNIF